MSSSLFFFLSTFFFVVVSSLAAVSFLAAFSSLDAISLVATVSLLATVPSLDAILCLALSSSFLGCDLSRFFFWSLIPPYTRLPFGTYTGVIMDVLGLLSNISQVVDLLVKIGVMCSIYCFDVKNAPKEIRLLLREVDRLTVVIKELEVLLNGSKGATKIESPVLRQTVFDLRRLLSELVAKLDLGAKNTSTRATWPFKKREIHDILATIDRQKANIVLNMTIEQTFVNPLPKRVASF